MICTPGFAFCAVHHLHPFKGVRRTHLEICLRQMECHDPPPSNATLYRRIAALSSWFAWLEDEDINAGNAAALVRRPVRCSGPQP